MLRLYITLENFQFLFDLAKQELHFLISHVNNVTAKLLSFPFYRTSIYVLCKNMLKSSCND